MSETALDTEVLTVDPRELVLLEHNARYMTKDQFAQLVDNVARDGRLTSLPLVAPLPDGRAEVLSGNHRTKAAIAAGLAEIQVLRINTELTPVQRKAIQLSHNSIAGHDDPHKLRELFDSIDDLDWREYSGLDDESLDMLLHQVQIPPLASTALEYGTVTFLLLPDQLDSARSAMDEAAAAVSGDDLWLARFSAYDDLLDALDVAGRLNGGKSQALALETVLAIFRLHVQDYADRAELYATSSNAAPLPAILGWDLPPAAASTIAAAVRRKTALQEIAEPWEAVLQWATEFLDADAIAHPDAIR